MWNKIECERNNYGKVTYGVYLLFLIANIFLIIIGKES